MDSILGLIDAGDLCGTAFLILIVAGVGSKMVEGYPSAHRAGRRLSAAAFIAYVALAAMRFEPAGVSAWIGILLRGLLAAGLTLGVAWIALSALTFTCDLVIARPLEAMRQWAKEARLRRARTQEPIRPIEPPPAPPPAPPSLQVTVDQARQEYEATCAALRAAALDEAELEAALLYARQKYLRRIHGVMKP